MSRDFDFFNFKGSSGPAFWLRVALVALAALNLLAIYFYVAPPGGSRRELTGQDESIRRDTQVRRAAAERLKLVSEKVQLGGEQTSHFSDQYFLPNRTAFAVLLGELLRMSTAAGLKEGQRSYSHEPIENTDDLDLLTINATYTGDYSSLMKFVNQIDRSDQLLILDTLSATPLQQGAGILNVQMRFLAVVKEDGTQLDGQVVGGRQ